MPSPKSMVRLFGKKKKQTQANAQENNEKQINNLQLKVSVLDKKVLDLQKQAVIAAKGGNKRKALDLLRQKKLFETQIQQVTGMITNLQKQSFALQNASLNKAVFDTIRSNNETLKKQLGKLKIEDVDELKDDIEETMDLNNGIAEVLSQEIGLPVDEGELDAEYQELLGKDAQEKEDSDVSVLDSLMKAYSA